MDKMKHLFLVSTTVFMLLLSLATENIFAWPCNPPPCPTCETCRPTGCECLVECGCGGGTCSGCCVCSGCSCVPGSCPACKSCVGCSCECTSECCQDSDCGDPFCYNCVSCNCVLEGFAECGKDEDCPPEAYCDESVCTCKCDSGSCWDFETVPILIEICPDCSSFWFGCEGMVEISFSYTIWVAVAPGGSGHCKHPTKTETVGFLYECTEDWDVLEIIKCAAESVLCGTICKFGPWYACVACLIVEAIDCASGGMCSFVDDCIPDADTAFPIEMEVVDFGEDPGVRMPCGSG